MEWIECNVDRLWCCPDCGSFTHKQCDGNGEYHRFVCLKTKKLINTGDEITFCNNCQVGIKQEDLHNGFQN
jgi:hypothetical protein